MINKARRLLTDERRAERVETIRQRIEAGDTAKAIAADLHCSLSEVYRVCHNARLKFKRHKRSETQRLEVARYYQGHSLKDTIAKFKLSAPTIIADAKLLGVRKTRGRVYSSDTLDRCGLRIYKQGAQYWLLRDETGKKLPLDYFKDVCPLRNDPMKWLSENAEGLNRYFGRGE